MARRDNDFKLVWVALSVSLIGSEITYLALPLLAIASLHVTPTQMGVLSASGQAPFLILSLFAGIVVDRVRRRQLLVATDLVSSFALVSIPIAAIFQQLTFMHLCVASFVVGSASVFSEVAHYSFVPNLVGRRALTSANSRLQVSYSFAESAGPGVGGLLIQAFSAPFAIFVDAVSFLVSAVLLLRVKHREERVVESEIRISIGRQLRDGLVFLFAHRLLRPIILTGVFVGLFEGASSALYVLYATTQLTLTPAQIGIVFVTAGIGALPGAVLASWFGRRFGIGPAIVIGLFGSTVSIVALNFVTGTPIFTIVILGVAKALGALLFTVANIHQWTLRQNLTPDRLAGRVTAAQRFLVYGAGALGALGGGMLAGVTSIRVGILVTAAGAVAAPLIVVFSPIRHLREQPQPDQA